FCFFFQAEDGIRDRNVTGVQTCALPISPFSLTRRCLAIYSDLILREIENAEYIAGHRLVKEKGVKYGLFTEDGNIWDYYPYWQKIGRASCRERVVDGVRERGLLDKIEER